jgi:hypothetical protein
MRCDAMRCGGRLGPARYGPTADLNAAGRSVPETRALLGSGLLPRFVTKFCAGTAGSKTPSSSSTTTI